MRTLEIALVAVLAVALVVGPFRRRRMFASLAVIAAGVALAHAVIEGARWQMAPAYLLTFSLVTVGVAGLLGWRPPRWASIGGTAAGALAVALSAALALVLPVPTLPTPTGPHRIGTFTVAVTDKTRPEPFTPDPDDRRRLMAQVWYPSDAVEGPREPYIRDTQVFASVAQVFGMPGFIMDHLALVRTHSIIDAPPPTDSAKYPVVVFVTGNAGFRQSNTIQVEELVSHGYVVVGIDQPGTAGSVLFPDGDRIDYATPEVVRPLIDQSVDPRPNPPELHGQTYPDGIIPLLTDDVRFMIDEIERMNADTGPLAGRLDTSLIGVLGISLGGIVAADACATEPRVAACLAMDSTMTVRTMGNSISAPVMWLTRPNSDMRAEDWPESEIALHATQRSAFESATGPAWFVTISGMFHLDFTDAPYGSPLFAWLGQDGPIGGDRAHEVVRAVTVAFFDTALRGVPGARSELLTNPADAGYPEVTVHARGAP